jgi:hypothetical protein
MKANMNNTDRLLRILIAIVIIGLYFSKVITATLAIVLLALATIFILTSLINFCPLYSIFGIRTNKQKNKY